MTAELVGSETTPLGHTTSPPEINKVKLKSSIKHRAS